MRAYYRVYLVGREVVGAKKLLFTTLLPAILVSLLLEDARSLLFKRLEEGGVVG